MEHIKADRVQQTTSWMGLGWLGLDGSPPPRMRTFDAVMNDGDICWVLIEHQTAAEWEISLATYSGAAISRAFALGSSSSTGGLVNFSAGWKTVSLIAPAGATPIVDGAGNLFAPGQIRAASVIKSVNPFGNITALQADNGIGFRWTLANDGTFSLQRTVDEFANVTHIPIKAGAAGEVYLGSIGTTASPSNAFIDSGAGNSVLRSTSSLIYKRDVEDMDSAIADEVVERARPIWYRSTSPADRGDWSWVGLAAEELAAIEPRLVIFGYQDHHYDLVEVEPATEEKPARMERRLKADAVKVPDGVAYDRLSVLLLDVARRDRARVAALEATVAALTARVDALVAP